ncbi:MAG TPA: FAD-dependent monooxygenase [Nocardioides sp.]|nr:FAD-dependent monooxygenase [uncultured Nocardioides sp.]HRI94019.1 FAD-dependent monooxygenase [Nocardioides sp.]HRK44073.1 FAD-dependent monooxygenase [Nocardioides sp.]
MEEFPVLVVGAGPVGLAIACELGFRSVPTLLLDQGDGSVTFPAGEAIFSRTMEHLRRWGIAGQARATSLPPHNYPHRIVFMTRVAGHLLAEFDSSATNGHAGAFAEIAAEGPAFISKFSFVPTLQRAAGALGTDVRYGHRVVEVVQDEHGVTSTVEDDTGEVQQIRSRFLVSCEGGRSSIRRALGIPMEGHFAQGQNVAVHFRAPALAGLLDKYAGGPAVQIQTLATPERPYITVVNGSDEWRLSMYATAEVGVAEALRLIHAAVGRKIDVEILSAQPWSGHRVVAKSYRQGRVFLAGDAAHLLWPKGGFGANTGIGDAVDLGWKLAAVVDGWGGEHLLDSYEQERRPIAVRNVDEAARNWVADRELIADPILHVDGPEADTARQAAAQDVVRLRTREYRTAGVQLGYRYRRSPICIPDGTPEPSDEPDHYIPSTWPGCRAPHAWLPDGSSLLDHFGLGFTLLVTDGTDSTKMELDAQRLGLPFTSLHSSNLEVATLYEAPLVLIRPDGHVCWRGSRLPEETTELLRRVSGR